MGQVLDLGDGARMIILAMDDSGTILKLEWQAFSAYLPFPQAADKPVISNLNPTHPQAVSVLLLASGGQAVLNPPGGLAGMLSQLVIASLDSDLTKPDIDPAVRAALKDFPILTSRDHGWIEVSTDGEKMWVKTER